MTQAHILECVEIDDLQPELRPLADRLGIEAVRVVLEFLEGIRVDVRSYSRSPAVRSRYARRNYRRNSDGSDNVVELARLLNTRPVTVRKYLQDRRS